MSDPTITAFLTKVLCSHGGRLPRNLLPEFLELPAEQIETILKDEPQKFTVVKKLVLARSAMRICTKYLKNEIEEECDKLHLCKQYLQGKCKRKKCNMCHNILSDHNQTVLKANEISGLNEEEIKVLLLQNDNQLLPEACRKYVHDTCDLGKDCTRLHVCSYFIQGECNRRACKRSHHLLEFGSDLLLTRCRMSEESIQNFQMICTVKHNERLKSLKGRGNKEQKGQPGAPRGRRGGRGRPRNRKNGHPQNQPRSRSRGRQEEASGFHSHSNRPVSESWENQLCWSHDDDGDEGLETRIMSDWFSSLTAKSDEQGASLLKKAVKCSSIGQPMTSSGGHQPMSNVYTSYVGNTMADVQSTSLADSPNMSSQQGLTAGYSSSTTSAPQAKPIITPMSTVGPVSTPPTSVVKPSKVVSLSAKGPSAANSVNLVAPTTVNPSTAPVPSTRPSRLADYPTKGQVYPFENTVTSTTIRPYNAKAIVPTIKPETTPAASPSSAPSTSYIRLVNSTMDPSVKGVVQPQPLPATSSAQPDKVPEICLPHLWNDCTLGGQCPDMHYSLPYRWQIYVGTDWQDIPNMEQIEEGYCDPKNDRVNSVDFVTMTTGVHRVRRLSTPSSLQKPGYVLTTEWLWYWRDIYGTWTQYGHPNEKQVAPTISSLNLEKTYLTDPTMIIFIPTDNQIYEIRCQEMKQMSYTYTSDVRRRPTYLSIEDVTLLRERTSSSQSPLYTDIYPKIWGHTIGRKKVLVSKTSSEFSQIVSNFTKTLSRHVVKKIWRLQNLSLWLKFQGQKERMKKESQGQDVKEMWLYHGTETKHTHIVCNENLDWRLCGFNGYGYGQGSHFARDASYANDYALPAPDGTQSMFLARVLVGDYVSGNQTMKRPPRRAGFTTRYYDSCVDDARNPSIFVVFEKDQIYPEYLLEYEKKKQFCSIS